MIELLAWSAAVLGAGAALFVAVLAVRRFQLARAETRSLEAEGQLRPLALGLIEGEAESAELLDERDAEILATLLGRYARQLSGTAREHVAAFFERRGHVDRELALLQSRRPWRRATAAYVLGDMGSETAIPALVAALKDERREVRSAAARSLGRLQAVAAVEPLVYALVGRGIPQAVVGQALLAIGPDALRSLRELEARAEAEVRAFAVELVGLLGDASDGSLLVERLRDSSADVRAAAARALGRLGARAAAEQLRSALADRIPAVRVWAASALGVIGDRDAVEPLRAQAGEAHFEAARAAAQALARIDPEEVRQAALAPDASPHLLEAADLAAVRAG